MSSTGPKLTVVQQAKWVVYFGYIVIMLAEAVLLLGFVLKLLGASASASFTEWAYRNLDRVMAPFRGIFEEITFENSESVLDVSILFAMLVYGLVAIALRAMVDGLAARAVRLEERKFLEAEAAERERLAMASMAPPSVHPDITNPPTATTPTTPG